MVLESVLGALRPLESDSRTLSENVFSASLTLFLEEGPEYYSSDAFCRLPENERTVLAGLFSVIGSTLNQYRLSMRLVDETEGFEQLVPKGKSTRMEGESLPEVAGEVTDEASQKLEQVKSALRTHRSTFALELLEELERCGGEHSDAVLFTLYSYKSEALMRVGRIDEARAASQKAHKLRPDDGQAFSRYVGTVLGTGEAKTALKLVNDFLQENPASLPCLGRKVEILGRLGEPSQILELIEKLDKNDSDKLAGTIALSFFYCGLFNVAEEYGRRAVLHKKEDIEAKVFLGEIISEKIRRRIYESDGPAGYIPSEWLAQIGEANMLLSDAVAILKNDEANFLLGHARLLLAVNLFRLEDRSAAKRELELASTTPGNDENVARVRFIIAARESAISLAIQLWRDFDDTDRQRFAFPMAGLWLEKNEQRKSLEILESFDWPQDSAEYYQALVVRNLCYHELGETEHAKNTLAEMAALGGPNHIDVVEAEVRDMINASDLEGAHSRLLAALEIAGDTLIRQRLEIALARLSLEAGDSESAVSWFASNPDVARHPIYVASFLDSCIKSGDYERARELAKNVLSSHPEFLPALRSLQAYYRRLGDHEECLK